MKVLKNYNEIITNPYSNTHQAVDIVGDNNGEHVLDYIVAIKEGTVIEVRKNSIGFEENGSYGNYVVIDHGNGLKTRYAHLSSVNVDLNEKVSEKKTLGYMGATGYAFGGHLHFEMILNGKLIDPTSYIMDSEPKLIFTCPKDDTYFIKLNQGNKLYYKN